MTKDLAVERDATIQACKLDTKTISQDNMVWQNLIKKCVIFFEIAEVEV